MRLAGLEGLRAAALDGVRLAGLEGLRAAALEAARAAALVVAEDVDERFLGEGAFAFKAMRTRALIAESPMFLFASCKWVTKRSNVQRENPRGVSVGNAFSRIAFFILLTPTAWYACTVFWATACRILSPNSFRDIAISQPPLG